jgi:acid stress chaperone HdeB
VAKLTLIALCTLLGLLAVPTAKAQVTLDVSKITCEQLLQNKVAAPRVLGAWLSGYYSGKRNNTVLEIQAVEKNGGKVMSYCRSHLNMAVMQAVEAALGAGK